MFAGRALAVVILHQRIEARSSWDETAEGALLAHKTLATVRALLSEDQSEHVSMDI